MRLKLSENPRDWRIFGLGFATLLEVFAMLGGWRKFLPQWGVVALIVAGLVVMMVAVRWPRALRKPAHLAARIGFRVGQAVAAILLTLIYLLMLTPTAMLMRLLGIDPLKVRTKKGAATYWDQPRAESDFKRMF